MKKIALTIAAVATLGLAACNGASDEVANDTNSKLLSRSDRIGVARHEARGPFLLPVLGLSLRA